MDNLSLKFQLDKCKQLLQRTISELIEAQAKYDILFNEMSVLKESREFTLSLSPISEYSEDDCCSDCLCSKCHSESSESSESYESSESSDLSSLSESAESDNHFNDEISVNSSAQTI